MTQDKKNELLQKAYSAAEKSYSPYSKFRVGACLLCDDGSEFVGCNIENSAFSATVCAERTALFEAVKAGKRKFVAIAVASSDANGPCFPCGVCRQVLSEFCDGSFEIVVDSDGAKSFTLEDILPHSFKMECKKEG